MQRMSTTQAAIEHALREVIPKAWDLQSVTFLDRDRIVQICCNKSPVQLDPELVQLALRRFGVSLQFHQSNLAKVTDADLLERVQATLPQDYKLHELYFKSGPEFWGLHVRGERKLTPAELKGAREVLGRPLKFVLVPTSHVVRDRHATTNLKRGTTRPAPAPVKSQKLQLPPPDFEAFSLTPYGACDSVGKSSFLVELSGKRILADLGISPESADLPPIPGSVLRSLDYIVLTHLHIDHCAGLPLAYAHGCDAPIIMSKPGLELFPLMLHDSHRVRLAKGMKTPFTTGDVSRTVQHARYLEFYEELPLDQHTSITLLPAGHLLGAAMVLIKDRGRTFLYSGDISSRGSRSIFDAVKPPAADVLICESTYAGTQRVDRAVSEREFSNLVTQCCDADGTVIIPSFAVGRAQEILSVLARHEQFGRNSRYPVYVDGRLLLEANAAYFKSMHDFGTQTHPDLELLARAVDPRGGFITPLGPRLREQASTDRHPKVIVTTSGMGQGLASAYMKAFGPDPRNLVLFVGFQAEGSVGRGLLAGGRTLKVDHEEVTLRCKIAQVSLSGHANKEELLAYVGDVKPKIFIPVHGEQESITQFSALVQQRGLAGQVVRPEVGGRIDLGEMLGKYS